MVGAQGQQELAVFEPEEMNLFHEFVRQAAAARRP